MEGLLLLLVMVLLVLQAILLGRVSALSRELEWLRRRFGDQAQPAPKPPGVQQAPPPQVAAPVVTPAPIASTPTVVEPTAPAPQDMAARMREVFPDTAQKPSEVVDVRGVPVQAAEEKAAPSATSRPTVIVEAPPPKPPAPSPPPRPSFFQRHPDLEKFIGENLINKIGIAVLVVGIGLLLNYAIGKGLLSTTAQTLIGLGAGGLLVFFAHRLRLNFRAFSSVLVAGGIAIFYTTIAIAFHQFHLIGQTSAFIIMVAITGLSVALTLGYDRKELAVISLLGGFAAPLLASSGDGNYKVLFTYLLILDAGMLVLANYKKWYAINVLSFVLTMLILTGWAVGPYTEMEVRPSLIAFGFATGFFLVFFAMNLRYNLKNRQVFTALDHALLLANTAAYFGVGMHFLSDLEPRVTGLFTALLGLFYLLFAMYFHKREGIPPALKLLLIGLVLTFISLAAPVQLHGSYITLFWAAEAVLLLWFSQRASLRIVERGSVLVNMLMLGSLLMDLMNIYGTPRALEVMPLLNKGWITGVVGAASLMLTSILLRKGGEGTEIVPAVPRAFWSRATMVLGIIALYGTSMLELNDQLWRVMHDSQVRLGLMAFTLLYLLVLERFTLRASKEVRMTMLVLYGVTAIIMITGYYAASRYALWMHVSTEGGLGFVVPHILVLVLMVLVLLRISQLARALFARPSAIWNMYLWAISILMVTLASQELDHAMILAQGDTTALTAARRVGYPILWGAGSFLFMWYGMRQRLRTVRVIALCLFAITLLKLFLFDLGALSEGGRVAAFIFLGALLLVISFMYQRLKGLFVDDSPTPNKQDDAPTA